MSYIGIAGRDTPSNCWQDAMRRMEAASRARPVGAEEYVDHLEQAGRQTESLFQTIVERAPDAIVAVGCDGRIKLVNQQTEELFGFARCTLLGRPVELLLPERFGTLHQHHRAAYVTHPRTRPMGRDLELWGRRQDGSEFPVEVSLSPLPTGDSELLIIAIVRDISERKRLEAVERAAHAAAEQRQALLQTVLDQLPGSAYLVRGHDAALVMANRAATAVWGGRVASGAADG